MIDSEYPGPEWDAESIETACAGFRTALDSAEGVNRQMLERIEDAVLPLLATATVELDDETSLGVRCVDILDHLGGDFTSMVEDAVTAFRESRDGASGLVKAASVRSMVEEGRRGTRTSRPRWLRSPTRIHLAPRRDRSRRRRRRALTRPVCQDSSGRFRQSWRLACGDCRRSESQWTVQRDRSSVRLWNSRGRVMVYLRVSLRFSYERARSASDGGNRDE